MMTRSERTQAWKKRNPDKVKAYRALWVARNKEKLRAYWKVRNAQKRTEIAALGLSRSKDVDWGHSPALRAEFDHARAVIVKAYMSGDTDNYAKAHQELERLLGHRSSYKERSKRHARIRPETDR